MSEKRYEAVVTYDGNDEGLLNEVMTPSGERWGPVECADRLNQQAETIEVLREWLNELGYFVRNQHFLMDVIEDKSGRWNVSQVELAKRRIAALEGK